MVLVKGVLFGGWARGAGEGASFWGMGRRGVVVLVKGFYVVGFEGSNHKIILRKNGK